MEICGGIGSNDASDLDVSPLCVLKHDRLALMEMSETCFPVETQ